ncbi:Oidioi.mRNA.OKI2018_I69.XSR.g16553.t2.cds [Oikopleura dioica]|uniref:Oidioi.mRNA.OKI2018_I69.XSR.g16553.t2.cds n=1 Tax=Oikopleura dioica TaxID=34765 RepID=A0ABN7SLL1_OIKDI|nr:Oidioi.mRNA.OKI2018_I69.XSR.g16553.t2.cds [Oikopleura dioica]
MESREIKPDAATIVKLEIVSEQEECPTTQGMNLEQKMAISSFLLDESNREKHTTEKKQEELSEGDPQKILLECETGQTVALKAHIAKLEEDKKVLEENCSDNSLSKMILGTLQPIIKELECKVKRVLAISGKYREENKELREELAQDTTKAEMKKMKKMFQTKIKHLNERLEEEMHARQSAVEAQKKLQAEMDIELQKSKEGKFRLRKIAQQNVLALKKQLDKEKAKAGDITISSSVTMVADSNQLDRLAVPRKRPLEVLSTNESKKSKCTEWLGSPQTLARTCGTETIGIDPTLTKCQANAQTDKNVKCTESGLFEKTQCSVLNSVMQIHICRCVDEISGEDIPLTEKPVIDDSEDSEDEMEQQPAVTPKNCLRIKEEALVFNKKVSDAGPFASSFADLKFVPSCNGDGSYKALQCDEKAKSCWCADAMGVEVHGTRKATGGVFKSAPPDCSAQAQVMKEFVNTPPCERIKSQGMQQNLACDRKGYFEEVQVRTDESGNEVKYCVDPETGYPRENYNFNLATRECLYRPPKAAVGPTRSPAEFMAMLGIEDDSSFAQTASEAPAAPAAVASPMDNLRQQLLSKYGLDGGASGVAASGATNTQDMIRNLVMQKLTGGSAGSDAGSSPLAGLAQQMLAQSSGGASSGGSSIQQMLAQKILGNQAQEASQPQMMGGMTADNVQGMYRKLLMQKLAGENSAAPNDLANQVAQYSAQAGTSGLLSNPLYQQLLNKDVRLSQLAQAFNPSQTGSSVADLLSPEQNAKAKQMMQLINQLG